MIVSFRRFSTKETKSTPFCVTSAAAGLDHDHLGVREDLAVGVEDRRRREPFATRSLERHADHDVLDADARRSPDRRLLTGEEGERSVGAVEGEVAGAVERRPDELRTDRAVVVGRPRRRRPVERPLVESRFSSPFDDDRELDGGRRRRSGRRKRRSRRDDRDRRRSTDRRTRRRAGRNATLRLARPRDRSPAPTTARAPAPPPLRRSARRGGDAQRAGTAASPAIPLPKPFPDSTSSGSSSGTGRRSDTAQVPSNRAATTPQEYPPLPLAGGPLKREGTVSVVKAGRSYGYRASSPDGQITPKRLGEPIPPVERVRCARPRRLEGARYAKSNQSDP